MKFMLKRFVLPVSHAMMILDNNRYRIVIVVNLM